MELIRPKPSVPIVTDVYEPASPAESSVVTVAAVQAVSEH
jgi:hypothetical protein